jgi:TPR repeat protein
MFADDDIDEMYFEAQNWLRLALGKEDNADANYLMGQLYEGGLSVDQNHQLAYSYYEKAAKSGHVKSLTKMGHLTYSGVKRTEYMHSNYSVSPGSGQSHSFMYAKLPDKNEAAQLYQQAVNVGQDIEAMNCLGLMYE